MLLPQLVTVGSDSAQAEVKKVKGPTWILREVAAVQAEGDRAVSLSSPHLLW